MRNSRSPHRATFAIFAKAYDPSISIHISFFSLHGDYTCINKLREQRRLACGEKTITGTSPVPPILAMETLV